MIPNAMMTSVVRKCCCDGALLIIYLFGNNQKNIFDNAKYFSFLSTRYVIIWLDTFDSPIW